MQRNTQSDLSENTGFGQDDLGRLLERPFRPTTSDILLKGDYLDRFIRFADIMSKGRVTIPEHLKGSPADCLAVVMQAALWGMDPFAVASKSYKTPGGQLAYEAQLINAVVIAIAPIKERPNFRFLGDWSKILGRVKEMDGGKGKYYAAAWDKKDEEGLGVICYCALQGEHEPRELTLMMSQCYPRFSTQWAMDPQQQITYASVRKWARRNTPDVLLGVYAIDELDDAPHTDRAIERNGTPLDDSPLAAPDGKTLQPYSDERFAEQLPKWRALIESGKKTPDQIITTVSSKATLTAAQIAAIKAPPAQAAAPRGNAPSVTFAQIEERIRLSTDLDVLDAHADLIGEVQDPKAREDLVAAYRKRQEELAG